MTNYLTISDLCRETDVSNSSCRRYLTEFSDFFSVKGGSRVKKYEEQAVNVIKRIKLLYDEGNDKDEIYSVLVNESPTVVNDEEKQTNKEESSRLATSEDIDEIKESLEEQKRFNAELLKRLDQQAEYINQSITKRDQELMNVMNEISENKKQLASSEEQETESEPEQKKGFFSRLFGK